MKDLNKKVKVGDKVKLTLDVEIIVQHVWNNAIEGDFLDVLEPSLTTSHYNDICILSECIKKINNL